MTDLPTYFDRVVLINLKRRPDRLDKARTELVKAQWPFKEPTLFEAVDGSKLPLPNRCPDGAGAWGCLCSHKQVLQEALMMDANRLLVLEDDVIFRSNFAIEIEKFIADVPANWDQLMIGGQINEDSLRKLIAPGVLQVNSVGRTHCYAVQGRFIRDLYQHWSSTLGHCDHRMAELQHGTQYRIYAPSPFLAGQGEGLSDVSRPGGTPANNPMKFWNAVKLDRPILLLRCPVELLPELRKHNFYFGHDLDFNTNMSQSLIQIMAKKEGQNMRLAKIRDWLKIFREGAEQIDDGIATVYHDEVHAHMIRSACGKEPISLRGDTVEEILKKMENVK